jgi:putative GTP pyrophosphokinase
MSLPNRKVLEAQYEADRRIHELVLAELVQRFRVWFDDADLHPGMKVRVKSFQSWFEKVLRKIRHGVAPDQVQIHDVLGLRIVCPFLEDVRRIEELVHRHFTVLEEEKKGAPQSFKEFGYDSTHFLVALPSDLVGTLALHDPPPCEIQVRTILQDAWAEVEHELIYKSKFLPFDQPLKRKMAALNANLTLSDIIFQEIREYQRQLNQELEKRRHQFLDSLKGGGPAQGEGEKDEHHPVVENLDQALLDALAAHNRKNYKKAINLYSAILRQGPQSFVQSLVLSHRGMAYFSELLYENALDDFDKAVTCDPRNAKAFFYRGTVRDALEEPEGAVADFTQSLALVPYQFDPLLGRAISLGRLGRWDEALDDCDAALDLVPDDPQALEVRHQLVQRRGPMEKNPAR